MSYEQTISQVVKVVEVVGAGIMVLGGLGAFLVFASRVLRAGTAQGGDPQPGGGGGVPGVVLAVGDLAGDLAELRGDCALGRADALEAVEDLVALGAARGEHRDDVLDPAARLRYRMAVSVTAFDRGAGPPPIVDRVDSLRSIDSLPLARGDWGEGLCRWRSLKHNNCGCSSDYGAPASSR